MARQINRLSARAVETITATGRHADGGGLYLSISNNGGRRWVFLFRWQGRYREMGLGSVRAISLKRARELASTARAKVAEGMNPLDERKRAQGTTFGQSADELMAALRPQWRNPKHAAQWTMTLTEYAKPLREIPVDKVDTEDVLSVLRPIWTKRPETASRLRGRIERVLDAAKARGLRIGENPARWRGHLDHLLPARQKLTRGHHAAMDFTVVPAFMAKLRQRKALAARALEFTILTATRSSEVLQARWDEIDLEKKIWTVPKVRTKAGREHRVPLSDRAMEIITELQPVRRNGFLFPGEKKDRPLSDMTNVLDRMKVNGVTVHGFRSSFRDWASERTSFPHEVCEAALAHVIENKAEAAYRRGDLLDKRRQLMDAWATYCATAGASQEKGS